MKRNRVGVGEKWRGKGKSVFKSKENGITKKGLEEGKGRGRYK